eukprot:1391883-Amorphochlora_amoeboformis.AAC.1
MLTVNIPTPTPTPLPSGKGHGDRASGQVTADRPYKARNVPRLLTAVGLDVYEMDISKVGLRATATSENGYSVTCCERASTWAKG